MPKSVTTIHREIQKREYAKSPLGLVEKELGEIINDLRTGKLPKLPEDISEKIYNIREQNEKVVPEYVKKRLQIDREYIDNLLFVAMSSELKILKEHFNKHD